MTRSARLVFVLAGLAGVSVAYGQSDAPPPTLKAPTSPAPEVVPVQVVAPPDATEPEALEDEAGKPIIPLKDGLKQMRRIRLKHFGQIRNTEIRQLGISKLQNYNESKFYPHLLEIFGNEDSDVRQAVLNLLADQKDERADTTIAFAAVYGKKKEFRKEASRTLVKRMKEYRAELASKPADAEPELETPEAAKRRTKPIPPGVDSGVPWRVKAVVANGLKQRDNDVAATAAALAADLKLFELIPALVNAQLVGAPGGTSAGVGGGGGDDGALAYILVGTQQAFVADLEPVVGDSAVAFDPQMGVATSGTVMRVIDASVVTYRTEVHYSLRRLANSGWDGRSTESLGYDSRAWADWYANEFLPYRKTVAEGTAADAQSSPP